MVSIAGCLHDPAFGVVEPGLYDVDCVAIAARPSFIYFYISTLQKTVRVACIVFSAGEVCYIVVAREQSSDEQSNLCLL